MICMNEVSIVITRVLKNRSLDFFPEAQKPIYHQDNFYDFKMFEEATFTNELFDEKYCIATNERPPFTKKTSVKYPGLPSCESWSTLPCTKSWKRSLWALLRFQSFEVLCTCISMSFLLGCSGVERVNFGVMLCRWFWVVYVKDGNKS